MKINPLPSLEYLQECFEISSESPSGLIWKERPLNHFSLERIGKAMNNRFKGTAAGCRNGHGYFCVEFAGYKCVTHRIVYALFHLTTDFENLYVDHINRISEDNSPENLRLATDPQNKHNKPRNPNNSSGYKNICWEKKSRKWDVSFKMNGKTLRVGRFISLEDAKEARDSFVLSRPDDFGFYSISD